MVVGMLSLTGLGVKLTSAVFSLSGGVMLAALVLSMMIALILGMGLPTTAAYILGASVAGPALIKMGIVPIAAYLFIFYFATISAFTPPVCAAVYVASGIANSNWWKTGWIAVLLGISAFIVPFIFVYSNELLLIGKWYNVLWASITATVGVTMISGAVMGNYFYDIKMYQRVILMAAGIMLVVPGLVTDTIGLMVGIMVYLWAKKQAGTRGRISASIG
jgi:TRAP-type uncharacterized transport system fused permease subunit